MELCSSYVAAWVGGGFGREWIHVSVWLSPFTVSLRLSQHFLLIDYIDIEVAQLCLTVFHPMDCSLPGSSIHGIFQEKVPEWVAISFSNCNWLHPNTKLKVLQKDGLILAIFPQCRRLEKRWKHKTKLMYKNFWRF